MKKKSLIAFMLALIFLLSSCTPTTDPSTTETPVTTASTDTSDTATPSEPQTPAEIWGVDVPETALFKLPYPNKEFMTKKNKFTDDMLAQKIATFFLDSTKEHLLGVYPDAYDCKSREAVVFLGLDDKYVFLNCGEMTTSSVILTLDPCSVTDFLKVEKGQTLQEVSELYGKGYVSNRRNPDDEYPFYYTEATYWTTDGFVVEVIYQWQDRYNSSWDSHFVHTIIVSEI